MDFTKLLESLAGGDELDLTQMVKRKPNAPPSALSLPSETAMADIAHGAMEAEEMDASGGGTGTMLQGMGKGVLGAVKSLSEEQPPPIQPMQIYGDSTRNNTIAGLSQPPAMQIAGTVGKPNPNAITIGLDHLRQQQRRPQMDYREGVDNVDEWGQMRGLAQGGRVRAGETVIVGEDGHETVTRTPEGDVIVEPMHNPEIAAPMPNGIAQDENTPPPMSVNPNGSVQQGYGGWQSKSTDGSQNTGGDQPSLEDLYKQVIINSQEKPNAWKDFGFGALQGLNNYINKTNNPVQSYTAMKIARKNAPILSQIGMIEHQKKTQEDSAYRKAQTQELYNKNEDRDLDRQYRYDKLEIDKDYKTNLISLGKEKADNVRVYQEAIVDLRRQGVLQNDERIKILKERIEETKRHNKATEAQQSTNEEGRNKREGMKVAGRANVENIKQGGQTQRTRITNQTQRAKVLAAIDNAPPLEGETPEQTAERKRLAREKFIKDNE